MKEHSTIDVQLCSSLESLEITQILNEFEHFLCSYTPLVESFYPQYNQALWEMLTNGGKRFRPALLFCIVKAIAPQLLKNAFLPALAIECVHTYSLIHDDLPCMDNAALRRGHATLHTKYNQTLALLVGDGLNTYAFALLADSKLLDTTKIALITTIANAAGINGMVLGQALDCAFENKTLNLTDLRFIHTNKTAKLIAAALVSGGIIGNANGELLTRLNTFGLELGIYFQLRDDIIDACLQTNVVGKDTQKDGQKNSYVNLLGLKSAKAEFKTMRQHLQTTLQDFPNGIKEQLNILLKHYFKDIE